MSIELPAGPYRVQAQVNYISYGNDLPSPMGGSTQRINRLGDRFSLSFDLPTMRASSCGGLWATRLSQAARQGAIMALPLMVLVRGQSGSVGAPRVDGAGQLGMSLNVDGFDAGAKLAEGQYFSFVVDGVNYLHRLTSAKTVGVAGSLVLDFEPMLRVAPPDNTTLDFDNPKIEGMVSRELGGLSANRWGHGTLETITITEQR